MDLVEACREMISVKLEQLDRQTSHQGDEREAHEDAAGSSSTQHDQVGYYYHETTAGENDRNLNKILNQQVYLKRMIDQDNHIQMLTSSLKTIELEIEGLRRSCTRMNEEALKSRQELVVAQSKEIERYQMGQIRSISEDYSRHQEILEQRKKEILSLKKETEREERDRGAYLIDVEKKLEKQLQDRQKALRGDGLPFSVQISNDELHNSGHLELTSVDEYAPYGAAPHSRMTARAGRGRGARGGRGGRRGGRRGG